MRLSCQVFLVHWQVMNLQIMVRKSIVLHLEMDCYSLFMLKALVKIWEVR